jgi:hypothetical protein
LINQLLADFEADIMEACTKPGARNVQQNLMTHKKGRDQPALD